MAVRASKAAGNGDGPGIGHNGMTPDDFTAAYGAIRRAKIAVDEATGKYRGERKKFKDKGGDLSVLAMLANLAKLDEDDAQTKMRQLLQYAAWGNVALGTQAELFEAAQEPMPTSKSSAALAEAQAEEEGFRAGKAGRPADDCSFDVGSPLHVEWASGWRRGQAAIAAEMDPGAGVRTGRRKRGGNPEDRAASS